MKKFISLIILTFSMSFFIIAQDKIDSGKNDLKVFYVDKSLKVYPNPLKQGSLLYVEHSFNKHELLDIGLYNINGSLINYISKLQFDYPRMAISTDNIPPGTYILYLRVDNNVNRERIMIIN